MDNEALSPAMLGTIRNALRLIELLTVGPAYQQLNELAAQAGLTMPTVHRLLRSLSSGGLVIQNPESSRYSLGPEIVRLSHHFLMRQSVVHTLSPFLVELRRTTESTIQLSLLIGGSVVYVDRVDGAHASGLFRNAQRVYPALYTAAGRILLARASSDARKAAMEKAGSDALTPHGNYPDDIALEQWETWAQAPYLVLSDPYCPDTIEVAVAVTDHSGHTLGCLSATDHGERFTPTTVVDSIVPQLLRVTHTVRGSLSPD